MTRMLILGKTQGTQIVSLLGTDSLVLMDGRFGHARVTKEVTEHAMRLRRIHPYISHWGYAGPHIADPPCWYPLPTRWVSQV